MNTHLRQIETKIVYYNDMYRKGSPVVSDQVYDALLDEFEKLAPADDYKRVQDSLFSAKGKIKHQYVIGSLKKAKAEDDSILVWKNKYNVTNVMIVEKIDGMSIVLHYINGDLVKAVSRGDGQYGEDYTAKVKHIPGIAKKGDYTGQIRAELLLPKSSLNKLNDLGFSYKDPRNAAVGIISSDSIDLEYVKFLSIIAYQILGSDERKYKQYNQLQELNFNIPKTHIVDNISEPQFLQKIYEKWSTESDYQIDGLVIHDLNYCDENVKYPVNTISFKINDQIASTTVVGIEWNMSRDRRMKPVVLISPIKLGGAIIKRATGNNVQWIIDRNIRIGSTVTIMRSGDIIPKIIDIVPNLNGTNAIPTNCPHCNSVLERNGVDLICNNDLCTGAEVKQLNMFLRNLEVEGISEKTLQNYKLTNIDKLLNFYPSVTSSTENKIIDELFRCVFNKSKIELIYNLPFHSFGKKTIKKIMDTYGNNRIAHCNIPVDGISNERLQEFKEQFKDLVVWVEKITHDGRWKPQSVTRASSSPVTNRLNGMSFCFTGKLESMSRSEAEMYAKSNGAEVKGVSNKLTYLVTNNPRSGSSKNEKASKLGVKLITEEQFCEMIGRKIVKKVTNDKTSQLFDINDL